MITKSHKWKEKLLIYSIKYSAFSHKLVESILNHPILMCLLILFSSIIIVFLQDTGLMMLFEYNYPLLHKVYYMISSILFYVTWVWFILWWPVQLWLEHNNVDIYNYIKE